MEKRKINKRTFNILRSSIKSELFKINKQNQFEFIATRFKGLTVDYLYNESPEKFIDFLEELWYQVNILDKHNINTIIKELRKNS